MSRSLRRRIIMAYRYIERAAGRGDPQEMSEALSSLGYELRAMFSALESEERVNSSPHNSNIERLA